MASTLESATLTIRISEEVDLNGKKLGNSNSHDIRGINEVSERILTIPTTEIAVLNLGSSVGAGTYVSSSVKYMRLTNLDNSNFVRLTFVSGSAGTPLNRFDVKLEPQRTMMFTNASISGSAVGKDFNSFSSFDSLKAVANTASVDLELFVASE